MRPPSLTLTHASATKPRLLALADSIPGAWVGLKIAALLLVLEGQRPGWITDVLGLTRMSLSRWIHGVNREGLEVLRPKPKPGRPSRLDAQLQKALQQDLEKSPQAFGLNRVQWDAGDPLKAPVWDRVKGTTGAEVDASVGLSPEAGRICLSPSPSGRGSKVPAGVKKNSSAWDGLKR